MSDVVHMTGTPVRQGPAKVPTGKLDTDPIFIAARDGEGPLTSALAVFAAAAMKVRCIRADDDEALRLIAAEIDCVFELVETDDE
jgi:hypothetical protein